MKSLGQIKQFGDIVKLFFTCFDTLQSKQPHFNFNLYIKKAKIIIITEILRQHLIMWCKKKKKIKSMKKVHIDPNRKHTCITHILSISHS